MKPNFALNLSHDGIGLFHRTKGGGKAGWTLIDEVPLDDPDFADKLKLLRKKAADLEKGGLATKLIIPNSQILYTEVEAPGPDDISREVQIRDALEGLTPYEVGQLVFDWRKTKTTKVKVAIVARETLTEAEQFAKEHRFNPVSFVARPKGKGFRGEAFFGKSAGASALLGPGEKVEPDKSPVPDIETPKPAQDSKADNKPADGGETPTSPKTDTEVQAVDTPGQDSPETAETDTQPAADKGPEGVAFTSTSEIPVSSEEEDKRIAALLAEVPDPLDKSGSDQDDEDLSELQGEAPEADVAKAEKPASKPKSRAAGKPEPPVLAPFPPTPEEDDLPVPIMPAPPPPPRRQLPPSVAASLDKAASAKASKPVSQAPAKSAEAAKPALAKPAPPTKTKSEPVPAFSSRRVGPANEPAPASPASNGQATRKPLASPAVPPVAAPATPPLSSKPNGATAPTAPAIDSPKSADATSQPPLSHAPKVASVANPVLPKDDLPKSNGDAAAKAGIFNRSTQGLRKRAAAKTPAAAPEGAPRSTFNRLTFGPGAKADGASAKPVGKAVPIAPPPAGTAGVEGGSEAEKLTMFGARSSQTREVGGKPKYLGLMLILALLLIMA
ncbi:MAG TPA: hypothetical protein ENK28_10855, partial [Aliiroseovarius sp.]|nr:hypothetical protein [Aliiroseovarius sp.]